MKLKKAITISVMSLLSLSVVSAAFLVNKNNDSFDVAYASITPHTNGDGATYYDDIDDSLSGDSLLSALRSLNSHRKKTNGGYKNLIDTDKDFLARYTDYDPNSIIYYDSNNQPYSNTIVSFYSGNTAVNAKGMNREHVWPNSRGGSLVEADTHMARPTLTKENSSRGNSFYVEGMKSTKDGWDPGMESWGDETYRGDSARIIFYCVVANSQLKLVDLENDGTGNRTMGKLSDMLKWNLSYPVQQREMNRNEGVEYIQGNRNPFIDHPEYACKIWGNYNEDTKAICSGSPVDEPKVISIKIEKEPTKTDYKVGESLDLSGLKVVAKYDKDKEDLDVTSEVTASVSKFTIEGKQSVVLTYKCSDGTFIDSFGVNVTKGDDPIDPPVETPKVISISIDKLPDKTEYEVGDNLDLTGMVVSAHYDTTSDIVDVTDEVISSIQVLDEEGTITVTISYTCSDGTFTDSFEVMVTDEDDPPIGKVTLNNIEIKNHPLECYINEELTTSGLYVIAHYSDESIKDVTDKAVLSPKVFDTVGEHTVTVSYTEDDITVSSIFTITVKEKEKTGGCGGNIVTTSVILSTISLVGIGLIITTKIIRKKKENK